MEEGRRKRRRRRKKRRGRRESENGFLALQGAHLSLWSSFSSDSSLPSSSASHSPSISLKSSSLLISDTCEER